MAARKAYISKNLRRLVTEDFRNRCAYCLSTHALLDNIYEIDHIVPETAGGATIQENLCLACPLCNRYKGTRHRAADPATFQLVALYNPRQQQWQRHFEWSFDSLAIIGKTQAGRATVMACKMNDEERTFMRRWWLILSATPPEWEVNDTVQRSASAPPA